MQARVRLSETDAKGVMYYAQYFVYFDVARLELLRAAGLDGKSMDRRRLWFAAVEANCKYHASAKFQDLLELEVGIRKLGRSSIVFEHRIRRARDGHLLAEGHIVDVLTDGRGKPKPFPQDLKKKLTRYLL